MRQGYLGAYQQRGAIVLEVFGQVSLGVSKLRNFNLVGVGEKFRWLDNGVDLSLRELLHCFQFSDVSFEIRCVG